MGNSQTERWKQPINIGKGAQFPTHEDRQVKTRQDFSTNGFEQKLRRLLPGAGLLCENDLVSGSLAGPPPQTKHFTLDQQCHTQASALACGLAGARGGHTDVPTELHRGVRVQQHCFPAKLWGDPLSAGAAGPSRGGPLHAYLPTCWPRKGPQICIICPVCFLNNLKNVIMSCSFNFKTFKNEVTPLTIQNDSFSFLTNWRMSVLQ